MSCPHRLRAPFVAVYGVRVHAGPCMTGNRSRSLCEYAGIPGFCFNNLLAIVSKQ